MANETKLVYGTQKTLSTSIASISNNAISAAIGTYASLDTLDYPDADFVLVVSYGTAPTERTTLDLLVRPLNVVGTSDTLVPQATYRPHFLGSFIVDNVTTQQVLFLRTYDLPKEGELYLFNNSTAQATAANAELYMTPRTYAPS